MGWTRRIAASILAVLIVICVAAGVGVLWFVHSVYDDRALPQRQATEIVPPGATASQTARLLEHDGIIRSALAFELLARLRHQQSAVHAGQFRFAAHRTLNEVFQQMVTGGSQVAAWVTFPEGFTARQIAATLAAHDLGDEATLDRTFLGSRIRIDSTWTRSLEGFLFPSTYLVPVDATPAAIARQMTETFRAQLPRDAKSRARAHGLRVIDVVTLASLIEREAKADDERRLMAGVYYNRLRRKMPLEVDATIEYTFPYHKTEITRADLASDSPYNTYRHLGLPPTPIANPGRASLLAAFNPEPSPFLYYVYRGNGHHAFARTLEEHNANVARYLH
ncbi:MAG: endolytic transglycosylase MltG [Candidatus Eremiobacteraeota bacterium]|nr:endolytic transglycosylase MltG [Candidatus Eremiobacteraeota bacterium]